MGRDRDSAIKYGGIAGLRREGGKARLENPYCGPSGKLLCGLKTLRISGDFAI